MAPIEGHKMSICWLLRLGVLFEYVAYCISTRKVLKSPENLSVSQSCGWLGQAAVGQLGERESWLGSLGDNPRCNVTVTTTFQHSATNQSGPGVSSQSEALVRRQLQVPAASWTWRQQRASQRPRQRPSPLQLVYCQYIHVTASHSNTMSKQLRI